ncbi:MAG: sugar dehydrogenase complex small subunit [Pseudomonadota bacterium]
MTTADVPGRRLWLKTSLGLALTGLFADGLAAAVRATLAGLMRLSSRLTQINKLDAATGQLYLDLLIRRVGDAQAARIIAAQNPQTPGLRAEQNQLVADWYSGQAQDGKNLKCVDYTSALLWRACDFTKPDGQCGGATGYWALPPAGEGR